MKTHLLNLSAFFIVLTSTAMAAKGPMLECKYVFPIEQAYLSSHLKYATFDAALTEKIVDQYVKRIDPSKIYLLASDIEAIKGLLATIVEKTKARDCSPLFEIQKVLLARMKERQEYAKKMLGKDYKFDSKVEFVFDPQKKAWPATKSEAEDFLKKYVHFQISNYLATDTKLAEAKTNVIRTWDRTVKRADDVRADDLMSGYLDAFANALDPHSSFFSADGNEDFRIQMGLSLEGIGATLSSTDGFTVVEALVPGGAAAKSGLVMPQDKIVAVAQGEKGPMENVIEMDLRDVVRKIRGAKGTKVRLLVLRKQGDGKARHEVTLVRDQVKLEDEAANINYQIKEVNGVKKKIAILNLPSFYQDSRRGGRSSAADMKRLVAEARAEKADGMVLDLSLNGGGSLEDAVKIAGLFFKTGNVVKQSSREDSKAEVTLKDNDATVDWSGPLVVLISRMSASASEIVAGTLKDYNRAIVVGADHTFGKGTVQTVMDIPPQSGEIGAIKVTVGMFFTPGGNSTQHRGVEGDIVFPSQYNLDEIGEKVLDFSLPPRAIPAFISPEAYAKDGDGAWKPIQQEWVKMLAEKSKTRVDKDPEFKKIVDDLKKTKERGKVIRVGDALKDKEKKEKVKAARNASKEDKQKEYLKRADVQESVNILLDLLAVDQPKKVAGSK